MFEITAKLDVHLDPDDVLARLGLDEGGRAQQVLDQKIIDFCQPYVPASPDRTLEFSAQTATRIGSGRIVWNTPYAHYQYMGIVYGPNIPILDPDTGILMGWFSPLGRPKYPTDRELTYDQAQNPMAGSHWFERMKADRLNDLLDEVRKAVSEEA